MVIAERNVKLSTVDITVASIPVKKIPFSTAGRRFSASRGYAISGSMRGEDVNGATDNHYKAYEKISPIKFPETKYVFVEEGVRDQWNNIGSWMMFVPYPIDVTQIHWVDPMAVWHNRRSTLSFVDGHAIIKNWVDQRTIDFSEGGNASWSIPPDNPPNEDLVWLAYGYGGIPR